MICEPSYCESEDSAHDNHCDMPDHYVDGLEIGAMQFKHGEAGKAG